MAGSSRRRDRRGRTTFALASLRLSLSFSSLAFAFTLHSFTTPLTATQRHHFIPRNSPSHASPPYRPPWTVTLFSPARRPRPRACSSARLPRSARRSTLCVHALLFLRSPRPYAHVSVSPAPPSPSRLVDCLASCSSLSLNSSRQRPLPHALPPPSSPAPSSRTSKPSHLPPSSS